MKHHFHERFFCCIAQAYVHEWVLGTWRPRIICGDAVRPHCYPTPWWAGFSWRGFDPRHGGQRLHSIFRMPPVLSHPMLHRLDDVSVGLRALSKGVFGWAKKMNPLTLDEERPWHDRMVTVGVDRRQVKESCRTNPLESEKSNLSCHF